MPMMTTWWWWPASIRYQRRQHAGRVVDDVDVDVAPPSQAPDWLTSWVWTSQAPPVAWRPS